MIVHKAEQENVRALVARPVVDVAPYAISARDALEFVVDGPERR
jgi:hypothetical protein